MGFVVPKITLGFFVQKCPHAVLKMTDKPSSLSVNEMNVKTRSVWTTVILISTANAAFSTTFLPSTLAFIICLPHKVLFADPIQQSHLKSKNLDYYTPKLFTAEMRMNSTYLM